MKTKVAPRSTYVGILFMLLIHITTEQKPTFVSVRASSQKSILSDHRVGLRLLMKDFTEGQLTEGQYVKVTF